MQPNLTSQESVKKNEEFYDKLYSSVNIDRLLKNLANYNEYLNYATKTFTSWAGFYKGDFKNKIAGKKMLEPVAEIV